MERKNLQYTLLLLIQQEELLEEIGFYNLQYTLLLLIHIASCSNIFITLDLQYTLLLLILFFLSCPDPAPTSFTIHFATINTLHLKTV